MKVLVTGAAGLIGARIVRALIDHGHTVRALIRDASRCDQLLAADWVTADLLDPTADLEAACGGCDIVFHTAAHFAYTGVTITDLHDTAVTGTDRLLQACARAGTRRAIVTSSSVVFGYSDRATERDETAGLASGDSEAPYVRAKIEQHRRSLELGARLGLDVRLACPTMTLGPTTARLGPSNGLVAAYLADPFACTFPGGCNLVAAHDVARGHLLIAQYGAPGESYLLGSQNMTWPQIHSLIAELAGIAPPRATLTHTLAFLAATADELHAALRGRTALSTREQAQMIGRHYWYSHAKAAALGYAPSPARNALVETISWLAASPHILRETRINMHLSPDIYRFRAA
jgi:dihydroflavonol-4-reductase